MQPSVGLPPPLQNANNILPLAQGGVMAQMRRIFYCRINLAILLIGQHIATMSPHAAHRRATLAARCAKHVGGANAKGSITSSTIASWPPIGLNSNGYNRAGSGRRRAKAARSLARVSSAAGRINRSSAVKLDR